MIARAVSGIPVGNRPAPDMVVWAIRAAFGIALPAVCALMRLETRVQDDRLEYRFFPLHPSWRTIPLDEVRAVESTSYRPIREFGSGGIRFGRRAGPLR